MDQFYMNKALKLAETALGIEEVPIGCVIVYGDKIIGRGYNLRNSKKNTLYHAEIIAINEASAALGDWRLEGCTLYVTIEPCPMCAGAILQARIPRLVYGAKSPKAGAAGSVVNLLQNPDFNHYTNITEGVLEEECSVLMTKFFERFRNKKGI